ncbi:MAG: hypothetical protein COC08_07325 [Maribacter sp.]|nr:MAG: hypothetical protein COC08_07325 [Maribacter sp.]
MKKIAVTVMLLVAVATMAQERQHHHREHMKDLTPEQMATLQSKKMTLALDLSKAQQAQLKKLFTENATLRKEKMKARKAKKENGTMTKPTSEERYAMQNQRLDHLIAQKSEMKKILSQEQYDKWEKAHHGKRKHQHKRGMRRGKRKA